MVPFVSGTDRQIRRNYERMNTERRGQMDNSNRFFANRDCKYYPCHEGIGEMIMQIYETSFAEGVAGSIKEGRIW